MLCWVHAGLIRLDLDPVEVGGRCTDTRFDIGRAPRRRKYREQRNQDLRVGGVKVGPGLPEAGDADTLLVGSRVEDDVLDADDGGRDVCVLRVITDGAAPVREALGNDLCARG